MESPPCKREEGGKRAEDEVKKKCMGFIHGWISFLTNVLLTWNVTSNGWSVFSVV